MGRLFFANKYYLPLIIAIVIAASWFGALDRYSDKYTDDSIIEAGTSYAIARGINGIVSILQTSTIQAGFGVSGSMEVGQILDPVNDLIERFSYVMSLSLGSLALQKVLMGISSHVVFKILIAVFGLVLIFAILIKNTVVTAWASKIFTLLVFVRFSLVIVVLLNGLVDDIFITKQITSGAEELGEFRTRLARIEENGGELDIDISAYKKGIRDDNSKINDINTSILPNMRKDLANVNNQLIKAKESLKTLGWADRINPFSKNKIAIDAKQRASDYKQQIKNLENNIKEQENSAEELRAKIEVKEKWLAGEPIGLWEIFKNKTGLSSVGGLTEKLSLDAIEEHLTKAVSNIIHLSVLFILKTILIPIAFFFVFIMVVKKLWNVDLSNMFTRDEKSA